MTPDGIGAAAAGWLGVPDGSGAGSLRGIALGEGLSVGEVFTWGEEFTTVGLLAGDELAGWEWATGPAPAVGLAPQASRARIAATATMQLRAMMMRIKPRTKGSGYGTANW